MIRVDDRESKDKPQLWVALGDFGLAKKIEQFTQSETLAGTMNYLAPEILQHSIENGNPFSFASDIFALGVTLYQLITQDMTTSLANLVVSMQDNFSNFIKLKIKEKGNYSEDLVDVIISMLKKNPQDRITAEKAASLLNPWNSVTDKMIQNDTDTDPLDLDLNLDLNLDDLDLSGFVLDPPGESQCVLLDSEVLKTNSSDEYELEIKLPIGIAVSSDRNELYISNNLNSNILIYCLSKKQVIGSVNLGDDFPEALVYNTLDDTFIYTTSSKIVKVKRDGNQEWVIEKTRPKGIVLDGSGTLYCIGVRDTEISVYTNFGDYVTTIGCLESNFWTSMALDENEEYLWLCDATNNKVVKVSKRDGSCTMFSQHNNKPYAIAIDKKMVFIAEYESQSICCYDMAGNLLATHQKSKCPNSIIVDGKNCYASIDDTIEVMSY